MTTLEDVFMKLEGEDQEGKIPGPIMQLSARQN